MFYGAGTGSLAAVLESNRMQGAHQTTELLITDEMLAVAPEPTMRRRELFYSSRSRSEAEKCRHAPLLKAGAVL